MARIEAIELAGVDGKVRALLDGVEQAYGVVPNLIRTLAHSPAALEAVLRFKEALGAGQLSAALREQIALTVAKANECAYCASAHTALGERAGLSGDELTASLEARSKDPKVEVVLQFARTIVANQGWVRDEDLAAVREAGYGEGEIVEIIASVGINLLANYFNHIAQTELDFPPVAVADGAGTCAGAGCVSS